MKRASILVTLGLWVLFVCLLTGDPAAVSAGGPASRAASRPASRPTSPRPTSRPTSRPIPKMVIDPTKEMALDLGQNVMMKLTMIPPPKPSTAAPKASRGKVPPKDPGPKPLFMGVYEVTQEQYEAVMGKNPSYFKGAQFPVENVNWDEAVEFCQTLSQKVGKTVSLPTEAQWEYAGRADGDDACQANLGDYAWYRDNSDNTMHPVGQKKPNAWGLYDMLGSVWEWCGDAKEADSGKPRPIRGGGWSLAPEYCRFSYRSECASDQRSNIFGFRVVVVPK
ncbi:MAG: SUMF1/EgtB/PvdO family nonheme iron enzyme [Planctomycetota bacterium]|nr:SUMF1/EgtB/PvdO family nonheme iron enzyme [Planctomycetota bacterium]